GRPPERITSGAAINIDHPSDEGHAAAEISNPRSQPPVSVTQDIGRPPERPTSGDAASNIDHPSDEGHAAAEISNPRSQPSMSVTQDIGRPPEIPTAVAAYKHHPPDAVDYDIDDPPDEESTA